MAKRIETIQVPRPQRRNPVARAPILRKGGVHESDQRAHHVKGSLPDASAGQFDDEDVQLAKALARIRRGED